MLHNLLLVLAARISQSIVIVQMFRVHVTLEQTNDFMNKSPSILTEQLLLERAFYKELSLSLYAIKQLFYEDIS